MKKAKFYFYVFLMTLFPKPNQWITPSIILIFILFSSCSKKQVDIPILLKNQIQTYEECHCNPLINQYIWNKKVVYVQTSNAPNCDTENLFYDEFGVQFQLQSNMKFEEFLKEANFIKNVWTCN